MGTIHKMIRETCENHSEVGVNYAKIPRMYLEWSGRVGTHRNSDVQAWLSLKALA